MTQVSVQVLGDKVAERELYFIGDRAVELQPAWLEIANFLQEITKEQFATDGARSGDPWEPLSSGYAFAKWRRGERLEILRASDDMYRELTGGSGSEDTAVFHDEFMTFGSNTPEFIYQQGNLGGGHTPVRLPINLTDADVRTITGMVMDRIISGAGLAKDRSVSARTGKKYYSKRNSSGQFAPRTA